MTKSISRRLVLGGAILSAPSFAWAMDDAPWRGLAELEKQRGARIGVTAIDTANGNALFYREDERFLMCSTFKLPLVAAVLASADVGRENLSRAVHFDKADLLAYSPVTSLQADGTMTIAALCEAAITHSDNTAGNLLLGLIGGPQGFNTWLRGLGDRSTHLDRTEPSLNLPDGDKDTTTPVAMAGNMKAILFGNALAAPSRQRLMDWLTASTTGSAMLRAGLPAGWLVGDKTGQGDSGAVNDIAVVTPPGRKPLLVAVYTVSASGAGRTDLVADAGRLVAAALG
jgi:beta-lactamase class A